MDKAICFCDNVELKRFLQDDTARVLFCFSCSTADFVHKLNVKATIWLLLLLLRLRRWRRSSIHRKDIVLIGIYLLPLWCVILFSHNVMSVIYCIVKSTIVMACHAQEVNSTSQELTFVTKILSWKWKKGNKRNIDDRKKRNNSSYNIN